VYFISHNEDGEYRELETVLNVEHTDSTVWILPHPLIAERGAGWRLRSPCTPFAQLSSRITGTPSVIAHSSSGESTRRWR
jgi:hypothetical protein